MDSHKLINEIKPLLEKQFRVSLGTPRPEIFSSSNGNTYIVGEKVIKQTGSIGEDCKNIYYGKIYISVKASIDNEHRIVMDLNGSEKTLVSGLVAAGYGGLLEIPLTFEDIAFNYIELNRTIDIEGSSIYFVGHKFKVLG